MTEQQISRTQAWLESLRPKTLPLAFAAIIVGTALAWWQGHFDPLVALLALITAGLLQILSNLANDYGDAVKGSDKPEQRSLHSKRSTRSSLFPSCLSVSPGWNWLQWHAIRWPILSVS